MRVFIFISILFCVGISSAQLISGKVTDSETGDPVPYANVFFSGTTQGVVTNDLGDFSLAFNSAGLYDLVVSFVGYKTYSFPIKLDLEKNYQLDIKLVADPIELDEVYVNPETSNRKYDLQAFKVYFLGETKNAAFNELLNEDELFLFYDKPERTLFGHCKKELVVMNEALGYRIDYLLEKFQMNYNSGELISFGIPRFSELTPKNKLERNRWARKRKKAFNGSFPHFLKAAMDDDLQNQGYVVQKLFKLPNEDRPPEALIQEKIQKFKSAVFAGGKLVLQKSPAMDSLKYWRTLAKEPKVLDSLVKEPLQGAELFDGGSLFSYSGWLKITYLKEKEDENFSKNRPGGGVDVKQASEVQVLAPFEIYENGYYDVTKILFTGYLGWASRMAEMLPLGYTPIE